MRSLQRLPSHLQPLCPLLHPPLHLLLHPLLHALLHLLLHPLLHALLHPPLHPLVRRPLCHHFKQSEHKARCASRRTCA